MPWNAPFVNVSNNPSAPVMPGKRQRAQNLNAPDVSVIICAHNPRPDYLRQVLGALRAQTLPNDLWELLLIDNASTEPLADTWDLSWHPAARHIREPKLGLTHARLCGIREASGSLLIFVDDDNILSEDYTEQALAVSNAFPGIGIWGGSISGIFETKPPSWMENRLGYLAVGEVQSDAWSTLKGFNASCPLGAGMVVRKSVALGYVARAQNDPLRLALGRKGAQLTSGEDIDLAWSACSMGLGMGRFKSLRLRHLIGAQRLDLDYFERLVEGGSYSNVFLSHLHDVALEESPNTVWAKLRVIKQQMGMSVVERRLARAAIRGRKRGLAALKAALSSLNGAHP